MAQYQLAIMDCPERFCCVEASTKSGKTACMIVWLLEQALLCKKNQSVFWVAPIFMQSKIAFDRMRAQIDDITFFKVNESRLTLTLPHGSIIEFKSGDNPDSLYGNDCYAAVIDEASRMKEDSWIAVVSTLTKTSGKAKLIGNVNGRKNFFYKLSQKARANEPNFFYAKITAYDAVNAGILKIEDIEQAKSMLPENAFKQIYLAEASDNGSNPFGFDHIKRAVFPISTLPTVCYGIDLAKKQDWTVITGLDKFGQVSYFDRFQRDWDATTKAILALPPAPMCMDSTGVGDAICEPVAKVRDVEPFTFSNRSKQLIVEGLAAGIQKKEVTVLAGIMQDELESVECEYSGSAVFYTVPSNSHDDCVYSLALAKKNHSKYANASDGPSVW